MAREQHGFLPPSLKELLNLKAKYPKAPLVVGNTSVGMEGQKIF